MFITTYNGSMQYKEILGIPYREQMKGDAYG